MYLKIMKVMGKNWRRQSEKLTRSSWLFEITWLDIELMHETVILLSFSICFWQLLNKNKQLLSLLICCADQLKKEMTKMGQNIRWCWNHSQMCCLWNSYHFQSLFLANTQQKCTVRWHLMFVCGKAQFEKEMTKMGIKQTIMRKTTFKLLLIIPYFYCFQSLFWQLLNKNVQLLSLFVRCTVQKWRT